MIDLINKYVYVFLHPFQVHDTFREKRQLELEKPDNVISMFGESRPLSYEQQNENEDEGLGLEITWVEGIAISWIFALIMAMYELLAANVSLFSYDYFLDDSSLASLLVETYTQSTHGLFILFSLANAVFFPTSTWLYLKFWEVMIRFFAQVFNVEGDYEEMIDQVLGCSLTSHFLLVIPVFGTMAHYTANLLYIFAGLKNNMGLTVLQSIIVLVSPLFLMLLVLFLNFFFLFAMIGMI